LLLHEYSVAKERAGRDVKFRSHGVTILAASATKSEITGPALNPAGTRLYFSSQRGPFNDGQSLGVTYEIAGPFARILQ
jgi:hypothetical protein